MANNIEKLLAIWVAPAQDLENALQQLKLYRFVDTAEGAQLEIIGRIVGQGREGLSDDDYRRYIRARIAANSSEGTVEDIIKVAFLIVYDQATHYEVDNHGNATVILRLDTPITEALADIITKFMSDTVSSGVRLILEYSDQPTATWFKWDTVGQGWDNGTFLDAKSTR